MINSTIFVESLSSSDLLVTTKNLVDKCAGLEAELLIHLGEIEHRKLYLDCGYASLFAFCVGSYGFSEDVACSRIAVARIGRRLPPVLDSIRSGQVHLTGLRLLAPHLTPENHRDLLARAAGKSKREVEELVACLSPQPPVPAIVRRLPERTTADRAAAGDAASGPSTCRQRPLDSTAASSVPPATPSNGLAATTKTPSPQHRPVIAPLSEATFKIQFTASRSFRDKLRQAQDLLRHRVRDGDPAAILESALDLLLEKVKKERFATGRKPRPQPAGPADRPSSRHIPDAIKREVFERDGGRCTFVDGAGHRCAETAAIEFDHADGFARTRTHRPDGIRLLCRAHNQHAAEKMYGRGFMERKRHSKGMPSIRPGTDSQSQLPPIRPGTDSQSQMPVIRPGTDSQAHLFGDAFTQAAPVASGGA